ncbi:hypothetical protein [Adhaeretor mobilis]|uniref:Uncharacterized protein n=1 Tax=Adhaeretor mobilis TaxID=1930276 RepID=A0A517MV23_9BACT|nr:hypothetical protein [Adhaeretor mobilis]QDS98637.1 hypothetical protein HG15A2_19180 [Adhaeretor mobilis]
MWRFLSKYWVGILAATIAVALLVAIGIAVKAALFALDCEHSLHAMHNVLTACRAYVEEHEGNWPKSWDELQPLYTYEGDVAAETKERIAVDFGADPAELATQSIESFTGIRPKGPIFEAYDGRLQELIDLLKKYHPPDHRRDDDG